MSDTGRRGPHRTVALDDAAVSRLAAGVPAWTLEGGHLVRMVRFSDFRHAIAFVNAMAAIADAQNHHPDFSVHYDRVRIEIWTHVVDGLSENDFILAAKLDALLDQSPGVH